MTLGPTLAGRTVLAVFAHPDDESLACGGTLARLADVGARVIIVCASHGERGSQAGPMRDDELGRCRALEMREAAAALGAERLILLDHPDGDLRWAHVSELHNELVMFIRRYAPDAVITFGEDGLYWHLDHVGIHERTTTAVQTFGAAAPALYYVTMESGVMPAIVEQARAWGWQPPARGFWSLDPNAFGIGAVPPTVNVNVAEWVPRKLAAIRCHRSQMGASHPLETIELAEARRLLGVEHFHRSALTGNAAPILEYL